jgi:hypothetical protein
MTGGQIRVLRKGERVGVNGRNEVFNVLQVFGASRLVSIRAISERGTTILPMIPWTDLVFLDAPSGKPDHKAITNEGRTE